jgi:hypothetical protein
MMNERKGIISFGNQLKKNTFPGALLTQLNPAHTFTKYILILSFHLLFGFPSAF